MPRFCDPSDAPFSSKGSKPNGAATEKPKLLEALKVDRLTPGHNLADVTYTVLDVPPPAAKDKDRRRPPRKRTRLRCGKILDQNGKFLIECQVHDRTAYGAHLRLMSSIPLPRHIKFFDDEQRGLLDAEIVWRQKAEMGIYFLTKLSAQTIKSGQRNPVSGKYYAVS